MEEEAIKFRQSDFEISGWGGKLLSRPSARNEESFTRGSSMKKNGEFFHEQPRHEIKKEGRKGPAYIFINRED